MMFTVKYHNRCGSVVTIYWNNLSEALEIVGTNRIITITKHVSITKYDVV